MIHASEFKHFYLHAWPGPQDRIIDNLDKASLFFRAIFGGERVSLLGSVVQSSHPPVIVSVIVGVIQIIVFPLFLIGAITLTLKVIIGEIKNYRFKTWEHINAQIKAYQQEAQDSGSSDLSSKSAAVTQITSPTKRQNVDLIPDHSNKIENNLHRCPRSSASGAQAANYVSSVHILPLNEERTIEKDLHKLSVKLSKKDGSKRGPRVDDGDHGKSAPKPKVDKPSKESEPAVPRSVVKDGVISVLRAKEHCLYTRTESEKKKSDKGPHKSMSVELPRISKEVHHKMAKLKDALGKFTANSNCLLWFNECDKFLTRQIPAVIDPKDVDIILEYIDRKSKILSETRDEKIDAMMNGLLSKVECDTSRLLASLMVCIKGMENKIKHQLETSVPNKTDQAQLEDLDCYAGALSAGFIKNKACDKAALEELFKKVAAYKDGKDVKPILTALDNVFLREDVYRSHVMLYKALSVSIDSLLGLRLTLSYAFHYQLRPFLIDPNCDPSRLDAPKCEELAKELALFIPSESGGKMMIVKVSNISYARAINDKLQKILGFYR